MKPFVNRCTCGPVDQHHRCRLNLRTQTDADGIVYTLDFTDAEVLRAASASSVRYTTTSRKPGVTIAKPLRHELVEGRHFVLCECGCYRWSDDFPHAVRISSDATHRVDCMGRVVAQEAA